MVIKAILMDFNGVIINDESIQMKVYHDLLKTDGIELTEDDYYAALGMDDVTFVAAQFERAGKKFDPSRGDEIIEEKYVKWKELVADDLPLFDGIANFVEKMSREFSLGVVSMSRRREIDFVLETSGLKHLFSTVVSADDTEKCKPDPECFRIGFNRLDAIRTKKGHLPMTHGECLVIEDSPAGIAGARAADLAALGVTNSVAADKLREAGAGAVTVDLRDWFPDSIRRVFV